MLVQDGFLYLIVTRHKLTVHVHCAVHQLVSFLKWEVRKQPAPSAPFRLPIHIHTPKLPKLPMMYRTL